MKTLRRLMYRQILGTVTFVTLGFMGLFFFFDFVDELGRVGKISSAWRVSQAALYVLSLAPSRLYELLPISVLIGTIFVLARMAQTSEYTILRTSGLEPRRALGMLLALGAVFTSLTFATGEYLAPAADRAGQLLKARYLGRLSIGMTGAWLKEKQDTGSYTVNVASMGPDGSLRGVRLFEADSRGFLVSISQATRAQVQDEAWVLEEVDRTDLRSGEGPQASTRTQRLASVTWPTGITGEMVSVALLKPERMSTIDLFRYMRHLDANGQTSQRYQIEFWRKVFYPLSCMVMMVLALPFAYLHFRSGGISVMVFVGILIGISFFLLNNVFGHIGNLRQWQPWVAAAVPGLIYSLLSLGAFSWLVVRR
jgi:lipopolysaccharide export system permease protein